MIDAELQVRFARAVSELSAVVEAAGINVADENTDGEVRLWLDGNDAPLDWAGPKLTSDEWFFVTTLYGPWNLGRQRSLIRRCFPRFVRQAGREIQSLSDEMFVDWGLLAWMGKRLCRMAEVLKKLGMTMDGYANLLCDLEAMATPEDPMPALDRIMHDDRAGEGKTLSVFVRDCARGNCFPIDTRVAKQLEAFGLPRDESWLVSSCLGMGLNPRRIARIFYQAEGSSERTIGGKCMASRN